jgi:hypothetical protein
VPRGPLGNLADARSTARRRTPATSAMPRLCRPNRLGRVTAGRRVPHRAGAALGRLLAPAEIATPIVFLGSAPQYRHHRDRCSYKITSALLPLIRRYTTL